MIITEVKQKPPNETKDNTLEITTEIEKKMRLLANIFIDRFLEDKRNGLLQPDGIPYNVESSVSV